MAVWRWLRKPWAEMSHLHFATVRHILDHFLELKLCILYLVLNLGKSGAQCFKWYMIWSGNEEVMAVWRWLCIPWTEMLHFATVGQIFEVLPGAQIMHTICCFEAWEVRSPIVQIVYALDLKQRSYSRLKMNHAKPKRKFFLISQPRPHFEGCFAAAKPPFGTQVPLRSAVRPFHSCEMGCKNSPPPWNPPPAVKMLQASKWLWKCSRLQNGLRNSPLAAKWFHSPIATPCQILHLLQKWPFDCEMIFQTLKSSTRCKNDPQASKWLRNDF